MALLPHPIPWFSTSRTLSRFLSVISVLLILCFIILQPIVPSVYGLPSEEQFNNDPGLVVSDIDFYSLPLSFSSAEKIQQYLQLRGSLLANYSVIISLEPDSAVLQPTAFLGKPANVTPSHVLGPYFGRRMRAADIIWELSRTAMSNSCSLLFVGGRWQSGDICYQTDLKPINPAFILGMIQKESGLVYGTNSRLDPNSEQAQFLLDRVVGYYCFESSRETSCFDENPNWKYYKGFFRQLYFAVRLLRLREIMCQVGGQYAFSNSRGVFQVGNVVQIGDYNENNQFYLRNVLLRNGISCSMYIYTPWISSQRLALSVMRELGADKNLIEEIGLSEDYVPARLIQFSDEKPISGS